MGWTETHFERRACDVCGQRPKREAGSVSGSQRTGGGVLDLEVKSFDEAIEFGRGAVRIRCRERRTLRFASFSRWRISAEPESLSPEAELTSMVTAMEPADHSSWLG